MGLVRCSHGREVCSGTFRIPKPSLRVSLPRSLHVADGCLSECTAGLHLSLHVADGCLNGCTAVLYCSLHLCCGRVSLRNFAGFHCHLHNVVVIAANTALGFELLVFCDLLALGGLWLFSTTGFLVLLGGLC